MSYLNWSEGRTLCTIKAEQIHAPSMQRNKYMTAQLMQSAFYVYYQGWQAARKVTDCLTERTYSKAAQDQIYAMRTAMEKDLKASCNQWGYNDLYWCFQHMYKHNGSYYDDTWNGWKGICNIPIGVSNFIDLVESKGGKFADSAGDFTRAQNEAKRLAEAGRWEKVGEELEKVKSTLETYGPYLWVCIPGNPGKAPRTVELISKCLEYAGQIHGTLSKGLSAEKNLHAARFDPNFKRDLFVESMAAVVGRLPIMGPLYAEVIRGASSAIDYFRRIARERDAMLQQIMR